MTISAIIVKDSISEAGKRLTTFELRYPRFIHAEFLTHRVLSRNASSSRAIPVAKLIADVERDPAMPIYWGSNKSGMQAGEELKYEALYQAKAAWFEAAESAAKRARRLMDLGLHKQVANRLLEPFSHINVVCTSTEWENFFALRRHPDAQPEIHALADAMWSAMQDSEPELRAGGSAYHLPYVMLSEFHEWVLGDGVTAENFMREHGFKDGYEVLIRLSVARCARVSYKTHEGKHPTLEEDLALYERLVGSVPLHASPIEHQARPDRLYRIATATKTKEEWANPHLHGNFVGWIQRRKELEQQAA